MKLKFKIFLIFVSLLFLFVQTPPTETSSASNSFFLSPSSGTKYVGDRFNVYVYVAASQAVNTFDIYISTSNMTVLGINSAGSTCLLFPEQPSYTSSTARFRCGLPTPGFTGSRGYIGSVVVKADSPGLGKVLLNSNSQILANDGSGTNVLTGVGSATYNILPLPTSAPTVTSSTHPNQDLWYKKTSATLNWSASGNNFSYSLDQNPDTTPDQVSEGSQTTKTFDSLTDGVWYFHIIVRGNNNIWSSPTTFRLQIDTTPPEKFTPEADPKSGDKRPIIGFTTTDKTSGVDHYELKLDNGKFVKVPNSYQIPSITSGKHTIYVKALDKAGNEQLGSVEVTIKDILNPVITAPINGALIPYGANLLIQGTSISGYSVKIFLDGKNIGTVKVDKKGRFELLYKDLLKAGKHELYAVAVNSDQIESQKSKNINFTLDPNSYIILGQTIPAISIWVTFIVIILILIVLFIFFWLGAKRFRKKLKKVLEELEQKVETDLDKAKVKKETKKEVEEDFEKAESEVD